MLIVAASTPQILVCLGIFRVFCVAKITEQNKCFGQIWGPWFSQIPTTFCRFLQAYGHPHFCVASACFFFWWRTCRLSKNPRKDFGVFSPFLVANLHFNAQHGMAIVAVFDENTETEPEFMKVCFVPTWRLCTGHLCWNLSSVHNRAEILTPTMCSKVTITPSIRGCTPDGIPRP